MKETNLRKIQKLDEVGKANVEGGEAEDLPGKETRDNVIYKQVALTSMWHHSKNSPKTPKIVL